METFKEFITRHDEGLLGGILGKKSVSPSTDPIIPGVLAYHIADAINGAMIQTGAMPAPLAHRPYGDVPGDTRYDATLKTRLRNMFYNKAKQMWATGDVQGLLDYFGYDAQRGRPVGPGRFVSDIHAATQQVA